MVAEPAELTPGGLNSGRMVIGALKPGLRSATILRFIEPFCTSGTFGSTMLILKGTSSVTATAARSTSWLPVDRLPGRPDDQLAPSGGIGSAIFCLGSACFAVKRASVPATGASAAASKTTGTTSRLAAMFSAVSVTPAGSPSAPITSSPPKSRRVPVTSVA